MIFSKSLVVNGVPCMHHQTTKIEARPDDVSIGVLLSSWVDEAARLAGNDPVGQCYVVAPVANLKALVANAMAASDLFAGAQMGIDNSDDFETKRQRKRAELSAASGAQELSTFVAAGVTFNCDERSRRRILEAALHAARSTTYSRVIQSADGVFRTLSKAQVLALADALDDFTSALTASLTTKLNAVTAALTDTDLAAITWP